MRKRLLHILIGAGLLLTLTACGGTPAEQETAETNWTVQQMASAVWEAGTQLEGTEILPDDELYDTYLTTSYGLDAAQVTESAIWVAGGTSAREVAVFQLAEDAPSEEIVETLQTYLETAPAPLPAISQRRRLCWRTQRWFLGETMWLCWPVRTRRQLGMLLTDAFPRSHQRALRLHPNPTSLSRQPLMCPSPQTQMN